MILEKRKQLEIDSLGQALIDSEYIWIEVEQYKFRIYYKQKQLETVKNN